MAIPLACLHCKDFSIRIEDLVKNASKNATAAQTSSLKELERKWFKKEISKPDFQKTFVSIMGKQATRKAICEIPLVKVVHKLENAIAGTDIRNLYLAMSLAHQQSGFPLTLLDKGNKRVHTLLEMKFRANAQYRALVQS